jgi:hypothetical protein
VGSGVPMGAVPEGRGASAKPLTPPCWTTSPRPSGWGAF